MSLLEGGSFFRKGETKGRVREKTAKPIVGLCGNIGKSIDKHAKKCYILYDTEVVCPHPLVRRQRVGTNIV